jgi:hypothetical protein
MTPDNDSGNLAATVEVIEHVNASAPESPIRQRWTSHLTVTMAIVLFGVWNLIFWGSQVSALGLVLAMIAVLVAVAGSVWLITVLASRSLDKRLRDLDPGGATWRSDGCLFVGPFDERGLAGVQTFGRRQSRERGIVVAHLVITHGGIRLVTDRARSGELSCAFSSLLRVELFRGTSNRRRPRMPSRSWKVGRVVLTMRDGRTATVSGTPTEPIAHLLDTLGARVQRPSADMLSP